MTRDGELLRVVLMAGSAGGDESLSDAAGVPCVDVAPGSWRVVMRAVADVGGRLDWLGGVDLGADPGRPEDVLVAVVALVLDQDDSVLVRTTFGIDEELPSVTDVFPAAGWHERETAEMLGVRFAGGDERHLLLADGAGHPMRRDFGLEARLATPWPGAVEGGRRAKTPGINPEWMT